MRAQGNGRGDFAGGEEQEREERGLTPGPSPPTCGWGTAKERGDRIRKLFKIEKLHGLVENEVMEGGASNLIGFPENA